MLVLFFHFTVYCIYICICIYEFIFFILQGGATGGTCAGGFGVCCYFLADCGSTYSQNLTYWSKTSSSSSPCSINVCKCQQDVCFLRLDFNSFNLYQPNTDVTIANPTLAGQCVQVKQFDKKGIRDRFNGTADEVEFSAWGNSLY